RRAPSVDAYKPPSEKESGVTLTIPMTRVRHGKRFRGCLNVKKNERIERNYFDWKIEDSGRALKKQSGNKPALLYSTFQVSATFPLYFLSRGRCCCRRCWRSGILRWRWSRFNRF